MIAPQDPRHGRRAGYCAGCRCQPCTDAAARYERGRQLDLLTGRPRLVPAIGAQRRAQALAALGYSWQAIGDHVGMERTNLRRFVHRSDQAVMTARLARRFAAAYDALSMTVPTAPAGRQARAITEARTAAQTAGWPPPLAWEGLDIDDPTTVPDLGPRGDVDEYDEAVVLRALEGDTTLRLTRADRFEIVARARARGWSLRDIEARTALTKPERYLTPTSEETAA